MEPNDVRTFVLVCVVALGVVLVAYLLLLGITKLIAMERQMRLDLKQYSIDTFQRANGYPSAYRGCRRKGGGSGPYTDRYDEVALRDHSDLSAVAGTNCFRRWTAVQRI